MNRIVETVQLFFSKVKRMDKKSIVATSLLILVLTIGSIYIASSLATQNEAVDASPDEHIEEDDETVEEIEELVDDLETAEADEEEDQKAERENEDDRDENKEEEADDEQLAKEDDSEEDVEETPIATKTPEQEESKQAPASTDSNSTSKEEPKQETEKKQPQQNNSKESTPSKEEPKKQEPKKEEPKKEEPKKEEPPKEEPKQDKTNGSIPSNHSVSSFEKEVLGLTNAERKKEGLSELKLHVNLSYVARQKSTDMIQVGYFAHNSPTYGSPFDMMTFYGISYRAAAENIAHGFSTPESVVNAWMNSPGHRTNIMNGNYTHLGVGYDANGHYWTQLFLSQ
ncbi:CAP domain-containing protein [Evansella cellulosilytica]|uniref:SCP-like extracellular n=1 Tax=Evansella cellulosilytica (strain ATCC 21833 / DSM 2522 / FERM P-1141 / JCM 9156 / N-4) TaxID=649639 RepID=E6TU21_EVAC2|nr:CAP domain-containing protein [Evansella cellulosilytica]ADU32052.1 SCP-like extracellular [Evansella cellulosilytica DSM 2522]